MQIDAVIVAVVCYCCRDGLLLLYNTRVSYGAPLAPLLKDKGISRLPESVYLLLLLLWSTVAVAVVCCCCCGGYIAVT